MPPISTPPEEQMRIDRRRKGQKHSRCCIGQQMLVAPAPIRAGCDISAYTSPEGLPRLPGIAARNCAFIKAVANGMRSPQHLDIPGACVQAPILGWRIQTTTTALSSSPRVPHFPAKSPPRMGVESMAFLVAATRAALLPIAVQSTDSMFCFIDGSSPLASRASHLFFRSSCVSFAL